MNKCYQYNIKKCKLYFLLLYFIVVFMLCANKCSYSQEQLNSVMNERIITNYEKEAQDCGAPNFRLWAPAVWTHNVSRHLWYNEETEVRIELHHVAGDIIFIAKRLEDSYYNATVFDKKNYDFKVGNSIQS